MTKIDSTYSGNGAAAKNSAPVFQPERSKSFSSFLNESFDLPGSFSGRRSEKNGQDKTKQANQDKADKGNSPDETTRSVQKPKPDIREIEFTADKGVGDHPVLLKALEHEFGITPARSILHVADVERIVASIRAQRAGDLSSVTVNLKHSVFEGLEFRVIHEKGRGLSAELIATSDAVRLVIQERSAELFRLFADRGIELGSLNVSLGNKQSGGSNSQPGTPQTKSTAASFVESPLESRTSSESGTSYLT